MNHQRRLLPSISALVCFEAVARTGSFTQAARELSLTQSAVSRQVRSLEERLDCRLLDREGRRVTLTRIGKSYVDRVRPALGGIRDATFDVVSGQRDNVLRIATLPTFGTRWLMPRIGGFVASHPDITLNFTTRIGAFDLVADDLDLAICHGRPDWPGIECVRLLDEVVVPVLSRTLLAGGAIESAVDILRFQLLSLHSRPDAWDRWFAAEGVETNVKEGMSFEHIASLSQACIAGVGVALVPEFLIEAELKRGDLVRVGAPLSDDTAYYVAVPSEHAGNRLAGQFRSWLLKEAGAASTQVPDGRDD